MLTGAGAAIDTTKPEGRFTFALFAALAEFERELIRERTKAGMQAAKRRGRKIGRPRKLTPERLAHARELLAEEREKGEVAALLGVGKATLRRALKLTFPDQAFDLVLCQQGLQFFSDRDHALREMRRVLAPDGRGVISVWQRLDRHPLYEALFGATARHLGIPISTIDVSFSLGDAEELHALLENVGFQRITVTPQSLEIRLPSPELFVQLTVTGAATSVPAFTNMDFATRTALIETVARELDPVVRSKERNWCFRCTPI